MRLHIRIGTQDDISQIIVLPRKDQLFQINRSRKTAVSIHHVHGHDIVMDSRLPHQFAHGLPHRKAFLNAHVIGRHVAADFLLIIGQQHFYILCDRPLQLLHDPSLLARIQLFQNIHRIVRIHQRNDSCRILDRKLLDILLRFIEIRKHLRRLCDSQHMVNPFSLRPAQIFQKFRDIILMVIGQYF